MLGRHLSRCPMAALKVIPALIISFIHYFYEIPKQFICMLFDFPIMLSASTFKHRMLQVIRISITVIICQDLSSSHLRRESYYLCVSSNILNSCIQLFIDTTYQFKHSCLFHVLFFNRPISCSSTQIHIKLYYL